MQVAKNCMMKPLWDPVLAEFARTHRDKDQIVMVEEVPRGEAFAGTSLHINASGVGMTPADWETALAVEG